MVNKRIVSLLPSATEIICALGAEDMLVGISHECDFPEQIRHLPVCTSASVSNEMSSREIDAQVRSKLYDALSLYKVDIDLVRELKPDLIITQDQCRVCAVNIDDLKEALATLTAHPVEIISLHPVSVNDILEDIRHIGELLQIPAEEYLEELSDRYEIIRHKVKFVKVRPKVLCIEWLDPLMSAGNWTPELIGNAGGIPVLSEKGKHSPYITWEDIRLADPDFIIIAPCGFPVGRTMQELDILTASQEWSSLKAVEGNKVFVADGNHYFNRSGPRIIDSAEIIAEILQVNQFHYGMEGEAWSWLNG